MMKKLVLYLIFLGYLGLFGFSNKVTAISIQNVHCLEDSISASINTYSTGGSEYYTIPFGQTESWSRSDDRGFIIAFLDQGTLSTYYSRPETNFLYYDGFVYKTISKPPHKPLVPLKTTTDINPGGTGRINMNNHSHYLMVGISTWNGGSSGYFDLYSGGTQSWSRNLDPRGYLVYLNDRGTMHIYYLPQSNVTITVDTPSRVYINNDSSQELKLVYAS